MRVAAKHGRIGPPLLGLLLVLGLFPGARPASAAPLSLEDVIRTAQGGKGLALQQEEAKVARAQGAVQRAAGAFDWTMFLESGWERLYFPQSVGGILTTTLETTDTWHTTAGVSRLFRGGISIQPGISIYDAPASTVGRTLGLTRTRPQLSLSIPLLKGSGRNNMAAANERSAQINYQGARLARDFAAQREIYDAVRTHWRCLATQSQSVILITVQQQTDADVDTMRNSVKAGLTEPVVLDRTIASQAMQMVSLGRAQVAEDACHRDLGLTLGTGGLPTAQGTLPSPAGRREALAQLDEERLVETAFRNRKDLQALTRFQEAADETLAGARNGDKPQVNLMVDTTQAMVRLSMPIGGGVQQGQVSEALAGQSEARLKLQELQAQIRRDIGTALAGARQYAGFWETLNRSQALLEGVAADAQKRQQNGTISAQDYRLAQDELGRVRPQLVEAQLQYASSLADLHLLLGTIPVGDGIPAADVARLLQAPPAVLPP